MDKNVYLDLDGVFANFEQAVFLKTGMAFKHGRGKEIFSVLQDHPEFFKTLPMLPCSKTFVDDLLSVAPRAKILTALPDPTGYFVTAAQDKEWWVREYLKVDIPVICTQGWRGKLDYVKSKNDVLVDDSFRNVEAWRLKGGIGIWHWGWESNQHTLNQIKEVLGK